MTQESVSTDQIRDELHTMVVADLLGPAGGPEEIVAETRVRDRYLTGKLAPAGQTSAPEQLDDLALGADDGEEGASDARPPGIASLIPRPWA